MIKDKKTENVEFGVDSRYQSDNERKTDGKALMAARLERMESQNPNLIIQAKLLQLNLKMEEYLMKQAYEKHNFFTQFLSDYIDTIYGKRSQFAKDIDITPVKLSQVLNKHREPQEEFFLKLMIHSELTYKSVCKFQKKIWYQVYFHEKICDTMSSQDEWRPGVEKQVRTSNLWWAMGA